MKRTVELSLEKAREWYEKGGELREVALQAYNEEELKALTYEEICKKLFANKSIYFIHDECIEQVANNKGCYDYIVHYPNTGTSHRQLDKLFAINKLVNVAKYLNNGWEPDWSNKDEFKYCLQYDAINYNIEISYTSFIQKSCVYFKTRELAQQAIKILGYNCIKLAIAENW